MRHRAIPLTLALALLLAIGCGRSAAPPRGISGNGSGPADPTRGLVTLAGPTMGTRYTVKAVGIVDDAARSDLQTGVKAVLARIDREMSTWRDDSELSRFNASGSTDWFPVSQETAMVVEEALRIGRLSGGAFDVTINPVFSLWGFGPKGRPQKVPTDKELATACKRVDYQKIDVRRDPPVIRKARGNMEIVLSAIAKGFAVDRLAELLEGQNVRAYMVEIGGEVRARGRKPDGSAWRIGIEQPTPGRRRLQKAIPLNDRALATSGDYRNYFEQDGRRYSHEIDPRTGRPIEHRLASVTVLTESCMTADALATALMVLGPRDGYNLAVKEQLAAYFLVREDGRFVEKVTPAFAELTDDQGPGGSP